MSQYFTPINGSGLAISATSANTSTALVSVLRANTLKVENATAAKPVYISVGAGAQTSTTTNMAVLSGNVYYLPLNPDVDTHIGAICDAANAATLHVSVGYITTGKV